MKTLRLFLACLFGTVWVACYGQADTTFYFDGYDRITAKEKAAYYRKITGPDSSKVYFGADYWMDGHIKMTGQSLDLYFLYRIGKFTFYYKTGVKSGEGQYYSDLQQGIFGFKNKKWETWYPNGKPKEEWRYKIADDYSFTEGFLISFWDTTGKELTSKGEGQYYYSDLVNTKDSIARVYFSGAVRKGRYDSIWTACYSNGKKYAEEQFKDGKLLKGKSFDGAGNTYSYDSVETMPQFPGGDAELNKFININAQASPDAKLVSTVGVRFFVGKNGFAGNIIELHAPKLVRDEVSRILKLMPRFIPATCRGQQVDSYYTTKIPVALTY